MFKMLAQWRKRGITEGTNSYAPIWMDLSAKEQKTD